MKTVSRLLLYACGGLLLVVLFVPMWRIELDAPQYPEGLMMQIFPNKLGGNVDIINGLNHYIGMKTLHEKDFAEFIVLPGIILFFSVFSFAVAFLGKRKWLEWLLGLFICFGVIAMIDFWRWEYNYGHDLNPDAAIIVPGMAYQPPLIGFKQLLNFGAFSMPDIGGYLIVCSGFFLLLAVVIEYRKKKKLMKLGNMQTVAMLAFLLMFTSCSHQPQAIQLNKDNCHNCEMTIADKRFGAELMTTKGKIHKFDDLSCMMRYLKRDSSQAIESFYVSDYLAPHALVLAQKSFFIKGDQVASPMGGNTAAFSNRDSAMLYAEKLNALMVDWKDIHQ